MWGPSCASLVAIQPFRTVFEIFTYKGIGVTTFTFRVTRRHLSRDHWIRNMGFPIGGQLEPTIYLAWLFRY